MQGNISLDQHIEKKKQYSCPHASPQERDAQYMYIVNKGSYLHPILVTFSKALRFILL